MPTFEEVAGSLDQIMGVKAVWGRSSEPVICFGSRGDEALKDPGHFQQARATANKAIPQPYLVTIGGGAEVGPELRGRVLELVRVTGVYGETKAFPTGTPAACAEPPLSHPEHPRTRPGCRYLRILILILAYISHSVRRTCEREVLSVRSRQ